MHSPKRSGPHHDGLVSDTVESLLTAGAVVLMLASIVGLVVLITTAFSAPRVGDIVLFRPGATVADTMTFTAQRTGTATRAGGTCVLDPSAMVQGGGSLVVEGRLTKAHAYLLHWAGGRTAAGSQDCGHAAELTMTRTDLETLVNAMGGRGIAGRGDVF